MTVQDFERPRVLAVVAAGPEVVPGATPGLSPLDLALLRGEAAFETMRVYRGRPFRFGAHLVRLAHSAASLELTLPAGLEELAGRALGQARAQDAVLRLICTRGTETDLVPTAFAIVTEVPQEYEEQRRRGLGVTLLTMAVDPLIRTASPWLLPGVKTTSYAVNMAAQRAARSAGADDAVFIGLGGELLESPTSNLWWRNRRTLYTPSLELGILAGVTRAAVLQLAAANGYRVVEGVFTKEDLGGAEEAFLSSSTREVMPVVTVDGRPVGDGRPGPAATALQVGLRRLAERQP
ncbi:MAG TPA: aminotransferase class IV [Actinomycetes bacterium]|jgi:4-amino-4-deoxychorismate lyase|nr:aminotransferase class IV [Actinomycetes bacterium]